MATILIEDLERTEELDRQAMAAVFGGKSSERLTPPLGSPLISQELQTDSYLPPVYRMWRFDGSF